MKCWTCYEVLNMLWITENIMKCWICYDVRKMSWCACWLKFSSGLICRNRVTLCEVAVFFPFRFTAHRSTNEHLHISFERVLSQTFIFWARGQWHHVDNKVVINVSEVITASFFKVESVSKSSWQHPESSWLKKSLVVRGLCMRQWCI
jgi:hypothetical protein